MTAPSFSSANPADEPRAGSTIATPPCATGSQRSGVNVSARLHSMTAREIEDRLDAAIHEMGEKADAAMKDGDPTGARIWAERMEAAIKSRSAAHKARRHEDLERRMNEGADYMQWQGRLDAELLAKGQV